MSIRLTNGNSLDRKVGTLDQFAVEIIAVAAQRSQREKYYLKRWLSWQEYEALKLVPTKTWPWASNTKFSLEHHRTVCAMCPLKLPTAKNCEPRLFGYGSLTSLRRAATELLLTAPFPLYRDVNRLINDLAVLFPAYFGAANHNLTEERDISYHDAEDSFRAQGKQILKEHFEPKLAEPPLSGETILPLADMLFSVLFFRPDEEFFSDEKLSQLVNWLERLLNCLQEWQQQKPLSTDLSNFQAVMQIYTAAHKNALRFELAIGVSW